MRLRTLTILTLVAVIVSATAVLLARDGNDQTPRAFAQGEAVQTTTLASLVLTATAEATRTTPDATPDATPVDGSGTSVRIDALLAAWSFVQVYETDADGAMLLIGAPPVTLLDTTIETTLSVLIEMAAREPGVGAHLSETHGPLITAYLTLNPEFIGTLSGRADLWLHERELIPDEGES